MFWNHMGMMRVGMIRLKIVLYGITCLMCVLTACPALGQDDPVPISTMREARALSPEKASLELPVNIQAMVMWVNCTSKGVFLHDGAGGIFATDGVVGGIFNEVKVGDIVQVEGTTDPGDFATVLFARSVKVLSHEPLPEGRPFSNGDFPNESVDCDWVKVSGRIIEVKEHKTDNSIEVTLERNGMSMDVKVPLRTGYIKGLREKLFEWVEFSAVAGVVSNQGRQFMRRVLFANSPDDFLVLEDRRLKGWDEIIPIGELRKFGTDTRKVIRTKGTITYNLHGEMYIQTGRDALKSTKPPGNALYPGKEVVLEGVIAPGEIHPMLLASSVTPTGKFKEIQPRVLNLGDSLDSRVNFELIQVQAELVEVWTPYLATERRDLVLLCRSGDVLFEAHLIRGYELGAALEIGAVVELTGICNVEYSEYIPWSLSPQNMRIQLRNKDDIQIIQMPPWWNASRLIWAGSVVSGIALMFLIWIFVLRKHIERQTRIIHQKVEQKVISDERQRIARELHDNLSQDLVGMGFQLQTRIRRMERNTSDVCAELRSSDTVDKRLEPVACKIEKHAGEDHAALRSLYDKMEWCSEESRSSIMYLRNGATGRMGLLSTLQEALEPLGDESGVMLSIKLEGEPRALKQEVERNLMMATKEALTNAVRHSGADEIDVKLHFAPDLLKISVKDGGRGFDVGGYQKNGHYGLIGIKERVKQFDGLVDIRSAPGAGTEVLILLEPTAIWEV